MQKKFGYDYENADEAKFMHDAREDFRNKVAEYYGGGKFSEKKLSRFDKMERKQRLNLKLERNPYLSHLEKVSSICDRLLKAQVLERLAYFYG